MKKIIIFSLFLISLVAMAGCRKKKIDPTERERTGRAGPGYKWELSTTNQENTNEYYIDPSQDRIYYLKGSTGYTRSVTLTVTKTGDFGSDASFRIYTGHDQCVAISSPRVSSGSTASTAFYHGSLQDGSYIGYEWSVPLFHSPVGTTATFTFNLSMPPSSCDKGYVAVDMASPAQINSASNYWDLDYLYVVKNASK